jgi:signal transduction histidine kinase
MYGQLGNQLRTSGISRLNLSGDDYLVLPRPLRPPTLDGTLASEEGLAPGAGPVALILRSRGELLRGLRTIHAGLAAIALVAVLLATLLSFAVARSITHPLAAITDVMREVAATGDLTRKITVRGPSRWDDEDARLLANTFNTLTESIARFQREMSQKERLTSLGRLSTVIAHEVRNPLMIIKAALHALGQSEAGESARREALADIDHEVARLNRIVNEVLDFSRPIRFDLAATDMGALCRESVAAAQASPGADIAVDLDPGLPALVTDAERLRIALVNLLVNARHAVVNQPAGAEPLVTLSATGDTERAIITITDRGVGMAPKDLAQVFDPYFTTRRGGTGLGLPIAKNIVEGLGGTIAVSSSVGQGTQMRIELPARTTGVRGVA